MRMRILSVSAAALVAASAAHAADLPGRGAAIAPAPAFTQYAPFSWTGFYAGLNAGYGWGSFNRASSTIMGKASGGVLGAQLGYNYQFGSIVAGLEGDANWSGQSGSRATVVATRGSLDWFGTLRGRVGFAAERALIYGTAGYAGGEVKATVVNPGPPAVVESTSAWRNGWALGAGIEYAFTNSISAKAEYLYMNLGSKTLFPATLPVTSTFTNSVVRAGVNYHF